MVLGFILYEAFDVVYHLGFIYYLAVVKFFIVGILVLMQR